ncbi:SH3 domain-containing protein [Desulfopila aestuarii]|uniref:SH3-like domain-containing protein n=1 Tax=Desulfopila aestuarii DSM 18488 TaxID=1121416 RepID=A0A1M7XW83_9BACT|nr:SH3 domain-containing protein [Desulfopila aestuarii]SHO42997.1 SH3-like domain-containing protein [Desulfopila aestuarii DSM 18488]
MIFRVISSVLALFLLLLFSLPVMAEVLSVKGTRVNLRTEPNTNSTIKWQYGSGFPLKIIEKKGDWVKVSDFEQDSGWINRSLLSSTPHAIVKVNKNTNKKINIRKGPSTKTDIVGKAFYGVVFEVIERKEDWVRVRHESGLEGWISSNLLWGL